MRSLKLSLAGAAVLLIATVALDRFTWPALAAWIGGRSYPELFTEAFGTAEITPVRIAMAIATYERTLIADRTPFDVRDLTAAEARGFEVFSNSDCNNCHTTPLFSHNELENIGVRPANEDTGRFIVRFSRIIIGDHPALAKSRPRIRRDGDPGAVT